MTELQALACALAETDGFYPLAQLTERPVWRLYERRAQRLLDLMRKHLSAPAAA